jgi:rhodanese-related sulfurtransferase
MPDAVVREIDRETLRTMVRRGAQLVEVLPREQYDQVHLPGATSLPLSMMGRHTADRLKWDQPVIVYAWDCLDDLSARAGARLASMGFTQVYRYTAGKAEWLANGLPAEGPQAKAPGAGDLADMDVPTCTRQEKVSDVRARVRDAGWDTCVVVNDDLVVLGLMTPDVLAKAEQNWPAEEAMLRTPATFRLNAPLDQVSVFMEQNRLNSVLVTTSDGKLFGLLKQQSLDS